MPHSQKNNITSGENIVFRKSKLREEIRQLRKNLGEEYAPIRNGAHADDLDREAKYQAENRESFIFFCGFFLGLVALGGLLSLVGEYFTKHPGALAPTVAFSFLFLLAYGLMTEVDNGVQRKQADRASREMDMKRLLEKRR